MRNGEPFADQVMFVQSLGWRKATLLVMGAFAFITAAMTVSSLIVVAIAFPATRDDIGQSLGFGQTIQLGDIVIQGDLPDEDDGAEQAGDDIVGHDPCEKPLTIGCEFAREPDIEYLFMPPFIGPWEEPAMRLHWTMFVITSRWQLVCPTHDP